MKTFSLRTLGCKVNQYESQQVRELLEQMGLEQTSESDKSELVVVNTCCVTHTASAKSRQYIRRAQKLCPNAIIVVCGCLPTVRIGEMNDMGKNILLISQREDLANVLSRILNGKRTSVNSRSNKSFRNTIIRTINNSKIDNKELDTFSKLPRLTSFAGHTRAFLKVQDGCDGYCSYCIVPKTRPVVSSKNPKEILHEAHALVDAGHKEIVVSGISLGAYGQPTVRRKDWPNLQNDNLTELIDRLAEIPSLARIRLSSLEPGDVTSRLLDVFCNHRNIMPHLHLSLQSGSDNVLKKMARQYCIDEFIEKVKLIKSRLDRPAITTDIIVGFPGETNSDFEKTYNLTKEIGFAKMHIFAFSARAGTAAANMQDIVETRVIKERAMIMRDLDKQLQSDFRQQFIGETATILIEGSRKPSQGRSERYFMVYIRDGLKDLKKNDLVTVNLIANEANGMVCEIK